jgi:hypothetical protein
VPPIHSSIAFRPPSSSPAPPNTYTIISNPARTRPSPSIQNAHSSSPSIRQSHSFPRITILSNPAREKQRVTQPCSTQSTQSKQNVSATVPAPMRVPTTTPISILKAPILVPHAPAPAPAADTKLNKPAVDVKAPNVEVNVLLPKIVIHQIVLGEAGGVHNPETRTDTDTTSRGEMLGVPAVSSRSRLRQNDLARYYPKELAEQIVRRHGITVRSGNRVAAARRREDPRQFRQATTPTATPTLTPTPSVALMVSRINKRTRLQSRAHSNPSSRKQPMTQIHSSTIRAI